MIRTMLTYVFQSNLYHMFYIVMITLCIVLLVWTLVSRGHPDSVLFLYMEIFITCALLVEIVVKIFIIESGGIYFQSYWNWLDFVINVMCIVGFVIFLVRRGSETKWEALTDTSLMLFRYVSQVVRILVFIQKYVLFVIIVQV